MNGSHIAVGIGATGIMQSVSDILMWATHWPIQPLDQQTATAIAALMVMLIGGSGMAMFSNGKSETEEAAATPAPAEGAKP